MKPVRLIALPLLAALAACGEAEEGPEGERRTAAGEVLGGTISDDMLPLDAVTSQSPPLREDAEEGAAATGGGPSRGERREGASSPDPAGSATPEPASEPVAAPAEETPD